MNNANIQPIRKKAISDEIVDQLIDLISRNKLAPGERLPAERDLCRQFGVGRTTLREALRSLATLGIIEGRVGEGTFISEDSSRHLEKSLQWGLLLDEKGVEDLIETRLMLECQTAEAAAERAGPDDIAAISDIDRVIVQKLVEFPGHPVGRDRTFVSGELRHQFFGLLALQ